ncbi:peptide ABC transporter ATPase [Marinitoga sp. 1135]|uniref:Oligopeptide/dipeptide ABC transporter, ATP-binding protein n=1 Tax=Marinitoga piezophila (strain DSM 14283 / JCM 11233 / KA3) TaxID=443254 RepID=H2J7U9_MARPK|nr:MULTISPECIES: ABC transporter ATP-binding protein [Marinitoga]AEX85440.1 oligopeptide/dipeptide ABC transporter, ATP-binding protein [Marinitoga piezophila KA3]APT75915.1 peptide ABC transporter ATPase [Marinitoga sp. 1137]NUU95661.1 peptide ABC transporter ATPase [Marinitoga sp. 1135]NUU97582.1 peptide ABC transporter ATPase [Marinitoga sp. 1138]
MNPLLEVNNLKVYYSTLKGEVKAIDGVSFNLHEGEVLGIAGESGCGKSTLVNFFVFPYEPMHYAGGSVKLRGMELTNLADKDMNKILYKKISIIPQYALDALSPTKKIKRIITDFLAEHGYQYDAKKVEERLEMVNLDKSVLNRYPVELSGGMKQRVVMVISTLLDPDILIADEVTSALDVSSQKFVIQMLEKFMHEGIVKSIMFITHDISVLYQIANRIMILYAGHVAEIGPTDEIIKNPKHPYTKALIDSLPKMNIKFEEQRLKSIPGHPPMLLNPPSGCRFADRCPVAIDKCRKAVPQEKRIGENHSIYCWNAGDDLND